MFSRLVGLVSLWLVQQRAPTRTQGAKDDISITVHGYASQLCPVLPVTFQPLSVVEGGPSFGASALHSVEHCTARNLFLSAGKEYLKYGKGAGGPHRDCGVRSSFLTRFDWSKAVCTMFRGQARLDYCIISSPLSVRLWSGTLGQTN